MLFAKKSRCAIIHERNKRHKQVASTASGTNALWHDLQMMLHARAHRNLNGNAWVPCRPVALFDIVPSCSALWHGAHLQLNDCLVALVVVVLLQLRHAPRQLSYVVVRRSFKSLLTIPQTHSAMHKQRISIHVCHITFTYSGPLMKCVDNLEMRAGRGRTSRWSRIMFCWSVCAARRVSSFSRSAASIALYVCSRPRASSSILRVRESRPAGDVTIWHNVTITLQYSISVDHHYQIVTHVCAMIV